MRLMHRAGPYLITALVFAAAAAWSMHLAVAPDPFALSSAAALAIGLLVYALIAVAGLLLSRGRWSKNLAIGVIASTVILAVTLDPGAWYIAGLTLSALAIVGLTGPWLTGWVRRLPAAEGPATKAILLVFGALSLVPALGVASPAGLEFPHGVLGGAGVLLAWGYARAEVWALWGLRVALPFVAIGAVVVSPWGGRLVLIALVAAVVTLAWSREAQRAVQPLLERLPGPRVVSPPQNELGDPGR